MKECPGCGGAVPADFEQCPACGERMERAALSPPDVQPEPASVPEESTSEPLPAASPQDAQGLICPECGRTNPVGARFCIYCRHVFGEEEAQPDRRRRLLLLAGVGAFLVVAMVAALFLGGFVDLKAPDSPSAAAAKAGAAAVASPAQNLSRPGTTLSTAALTTNGSTSPLSTARANSTGTPDLTPAPVGTLSRYVQNAGGSGGGGGGSHGGSLGSGLYSSVRGRTVTPTPAPSGSQPVALPTDGPSVGGYGYATSPLAWAGWGNWSPGSVRLSRGVSSIAVASSGTTAVILVDGSGAALGLAAFVPPGGTFEISVPGDGDYVLAIGAGNVTDTWTVSVLTATPTVTSSQAPVSPAQQTVTQTFSGTGGQSPPAFNLSPGTVSVQLSADRMTMAYLKDSAGTTLSTTVAGPNPGGSTTALARAGEYRLEVWGTGTWSATVTWTGAAVTGTAVSTVPPGTATSTAPSANTTPPPIATTTAPSATVTTAAPQPLSWSGTGAQATPFFDLQAGVYQIAVESEGWVDLYLLDDQGVNVGGSLVFERGGTRSVEIGRPGPYIMDIQGSEQPWRVSFAPPPPSPPPTGGQS